MSRKPAGFTRPQLFSLVFAAGFFLGIGLAARVGLGPLGGTAPPAANATPSGVPFRVVTFNVENFAAPGVSGGAELKPRFTDDAQRLAHAERIAAVIEALRPDVVNLCEVISKEGVELLVRILHEKGLTEYQGFHVDSHDTFTGQDVCFLSRHTPDVIDGVPIRTLFGRGPESEWREKYTYTIDGKRFEKTASVSKNVLYGFTINGKKLGFCGLHLKAIPDDVASNAQREAQATVAQRMIASELVARGYQPIVLGDLNDYDADVEDSDPSRNTQTHVLAKLKDVDPTKPGAELMNVAEKMPRVADRRSSYWDKNDNQKVDSGDVNTMLDHILIPREWAGAIERAFVARIVPPETTDHAPVVVDLNLNAIPVGPPAAATGAK